MIEWFVDTTDRNNLTAEEEAFENMFRYYLLNDTGNLIEFYQQHGLSIKDSKMVLIHPSIEHCF